MIPGQGLLPVSDVHISVVPVSGGTQLDSSSGSDKEDNVPDKTIMFVQGVDWIGFICLFFFKGIIFATDEVM